MLAVGYGCEEVIDSPFEIVESKLVIASTFAPDAPVEVRLTASQPVTGEIVLSEVRDATLTLYDGTNLIEELKYVPGVGGGPGVYRTAAWRPEVNRSYTLHAAADGFTPVSAQSRIPRSIPIESLEVFDVEQIDLLDTRVYDYRLKINYSDPEGANYYDLRISQEVIPFRVTEGDTSYFERILKSVQPPSRGTVTQPATGGQASVLVQDKPEEDGLVLHLQSIVDPSQEALGAIVAELRTVDEAYYRFQLNYQAEGSVASGIFEPRVNSYTNVTSGYGVFAGYSSFVSTYPFGR